jgi:hypothetical protein
MSDNKSFAGKRSVEVLEQLLFELVPGNYSTFGQSYDWKVSRHFSEYDYSGWEVIEEEFSQEYARVVSEIQEGWGKPQFKGDPETPGYPKWFRIWAIGMCYWVREEGVAYVAFHREDRELPYWIMLGAITEEAIEEISELGLDR